jgi:hypothetical protein
VRPNPSPANLSPSDEHFGYRHRASPNRCEGLYRRPIAGESIELLSFLADRPFDPPDHRLSITAPDVTALGGQNVAIVANTIPAGFNYRLDVIVPSAGSVQWPLSEVVLPAGLKPGDIGIVGSVQTIDGSVYVPIRLSPPQTGASQPEIIFRVLRDVSRFVWRLYQPDDSSPTWNRYGQDIKAGEPIILKIALTTGKVMRLDVASRPYDGEFGPPLRLKVFSP